MTQAIGLGMIVLTASTLRGEPAWLEHICVSHLQHDSQAKVLRDHATFVASRGTKIRTQLLRTCTQCLPTHSYLSRPNYLVLAPPKPSNLRLNRAQWTATARTTGETSPLPCILAARQRMKTLGARLRGRCLVLSNQVRCVGREHRARACTSCCT